MIKVKKLKFIKSIERIDFYKFVIALVWMSYAKLTQKILCNPLYFIKLLVLTSMLSLRGEYKLYLHEVIYLFENTCKAIGKILHQPMPRQYVLRIIAKKAFMSADINNNGSLSIEELEFWCNRNIEFNNFL